MYNRRMRQLRHIVSREFIDKYLIATAGVVFTVLFTYLAWRKHATFHLNNFDLAVYLRKLWGIVHGDGRLTLLGPGRGLWDDHFEPAFFPIAWLGALIPPAALLLGLQSIAAGATGVLVGRYARRKLDPTAALCLTLAVLGNAALQNALLAGFHMMLLALPFLVWFLDAVDRRRPYEAGLALLPALACREEVAALLLFWGIWCCVDRTLKVRRPVAIGAILLAFAWVGITILIKQPGLDAKEFALRFSWAEPFAGLAFSGEKLVNAGWLLLGFGGLPIFGARVAIWFALPLMVKVLSRWQGDWVFAFHHLSFFVPMLGVAAADGWQHVNERWRRALPIAVMCGAVLALWWHGRAPWGRLGSMQLYRADRYAIEASELLAKIDPRASVAAPYSLLAHVALRAEVFVAPKVEADHMIFELKPLPTVGETKAIYLKRLQTQTEKLQNLAATGNYTVAYPGSELVMLSRVAQPQQK